jgi:prophage regulatory protein
LLSYDELPSKGVHYSKPHLWRLAKAGRFPKPIKLSAVRNAWIEEEVDAWIEARLVERDKAGAA